MQRTLLDYTRVKSGGSPSSAVVVDEDSQPGGRSSDPRSENKRPRSRSHSPSRRGAPAARTGPPTPSPSSAASSSSCEWLPSLITDPAWTAFLAPLTSDTWQGGKFAVIERFLDAEAAAGRVVLPPRAEIFSAFNSTPLSSVRVVLLGQDPYHGIGQAHGLCFSVRPGVRVPPSLRNMYKELETDMPGFTAPRHGYLQSWAEQGVLMLNATLTVVAHSANSHAECGWQAFTDDVIRALSRRHPNRLVFLLWGNFARRKKSLVDLSRHVVIENGHPSPLSARHWFGCRCFSKCNAELARMGERPIEWTLPPMVS